MTRTPKKLKYVAEHIERGDAPTYVDESHVLAINQACISQRGIATAKAKFHDPADTARIGAWLQPGDVLINSTGTGTLGRVGYVAEALPSRSFADGHVTIIRDSKKRYVPRFLFYVLSIQQEQLTVECAEGATNQIELSRHRLGNKLIEWPNIETQQRIADYLDVETSRLDGLVNTKQRLLDLLTEKRRALIASAVTKGLNPAGPMCASGIEWLAQVPAHWAVFPLRRLIASLEQGWSPVASNLPATEGEHGVLKLSAVKGGNFIPHENKALLPLSDIPTGLDIQRGDVLLTRANTPGLVGDAAMVEEDFPALVFSDLIYRLRVNPSMIDPRWLVQVLISDTGRQQIEAEAKGSSGSMVKLGQDQVLELLIPLPPIAEQIAIVSTLGKEIKALQRLANITAGTIDLLRERRTALIAMAVAG